MKKRLAASIAALTMAMSMVFAISGSTPAQAYVGPGDDRQKSTATGWWWYTGVDASFISNHISSNNSRITDLRVETVSPLKFTVTLVKNQGSYATGWWWYYGLTVSQVSSYLNANHARLITLQAYNTSAGQRFAVVMVNNTGTYAEPWWWYVNASGSTISSKLSANQARLVHLSKNGNGTYNVIMVRNTGSSEATAWWWYVNASTSYISTKLSENKARIVDLDRNSNGTFNVVMYSNPSGTPWYWWVNVGMTTLHNRAMQNGQRLIDVTPYYVNGVKYFAGVMVNNLDALSLKLKNIIAPKIDSGKYGFYLKHAGGSRLASLQEYTQYEPASALKVLYHAKTIHEEALGNAADDHSVTYHYRTGDPSNKDICPQDADPTTTTNLKDADQRMMWYSDNRMTRGILEKFGGLNTSGVSTMEAYGASLGMTSTVINHHIGCGTPHNYTTLYDLGRVYESFQNGTVTSNATWQANFRSRMLNQSNTSIRSSTLCPIVNQEAAALGKSTSTASAFCTAMTWIAKGGSYAYSSCYPCTVSWDNVSMTGIPYKSSGSVAPKFFVFGEFIDGTQINSATEASSVNAARTKIYQEALRPYIRSALSTWA